MSDVIRRDLERKLLDNWESFVERELNIARHVLPPTDLAMMMVGLAVTAVGTTAATIANMGADTADPGPMFDLVVTEIASRALSKKGKALDRIAVARKAKR